MVRISGGHSDVEIREDRAFKITKFNNSIPTNILREIYLLSSIQHKNILKPLSAKVYKTEIHMEMNKYTYDASHEDCKLYDIDKYFIPILDALIYLHSRGIIHMDVKLHNILYSETEDRLVLADFSSALIDGSPEIYYLSTDKYRPPELKEDILSGLIDVYMFGTMLKKYTTNLPDFPDLSNLPDSKLVRLIPRMVESDYTKRITLEELAQEFDIKYSKSSIYEPAPDQKKYRYDTYLRRRELADRRITLSDVYSLRNAFVEGGLSECAATVFAEAVLAAEYYDVSMLCYLSGVSHVDVVDEIIKFDEIIRKNIK